MAPWNQAATEQPSASQEKLQKLAARMGPLGQKLLKLNRNTLVMALAFVLSATWAVWKVKSVETFQPSQTDKANLMLLDMGAVAVSVAAETPARGPGSTGETIQRLGVDPTTRQLALAPGGEKLFQFSLCDRLFAAPKAPDPPAATVAASLAPAAPDPAETAPSLAGVSLDLVLIGDPSIALISGKRVEQGQEVFGWVVQEIHPKRVVLQWRDQRTQLTLR